MARTTVVGACPHDCPDTCSILTTVEDGKAIAVRGNPDHPFTRGRLCVKVNNYEERVYSDKRVLYPLKRVGPKGSGSFSGFRGTRRSKRSHRAGRRSSPNTARRRSCPTAISARRASSTG